MERRNPPKAWSSSFSIEDAGASSFFLPLDGACGCGLNVSGIDQTARMPTS